MTCDCQDALRFDAMTSSWLAHRSRKHISAQHTASLLKRRSWCSAHPPRQWRSCDRWPILDKCYIV